MLGVAMDEEGWEIVKPYLDESKINYRVVMGNDSVASLYGGVDSLPTTFHPRQGRKDCVDPRRISEQERLRK